jgi:hypothetical protein
MPSYKSKCLAANKPFSVIEYFKLDGLRILGSITTIAVLMAIWDEWIGWNPFVLKYAKSLFVFVGFSGSSLLLGIFGVASKKVTDLLSLKANAFDNVTGSVSTTTEEAKAKADATGISTETPKNDS